MRALLRLISAPESQMDILDLIRSKIDELPAGPHLHGLRSVLGHIDAAYKHLTRGQSEGNESAFTDAIYRTNQAFEGSIKEAFRVLAGRAPEKISPHEIERYLEEHKIFRDRVLAQFTNYRTDWRNPSTHDYNLDFDEDEAFLATVSVSAFTKVLVDQIAEKLSFEAVRKDVVTHNIAPNSDGIIPEQLIDRVIGIFQNFLKQYSINNSAVPIESEAQLMGALSGFLASVASDLQVTTGRVYRGERTHYIDMEVSKGRENVIIELKRGQHRALTEQGARQLAVYMGAAKTDKGILFLHSGKSTDYSVDKISEKNFDIRILHPKAFGQ